MEPRQTIGLIGSLLLFVGAFTPIVSVPILGNMNYFQNGKGDGTIIVVLGLLSLVAVLARAFNWLWLTGLAALGVLAFTFINFQTKMSDARSQMETQLADNPFRGIADVAMQSVQLQWGWAVLVAGAVLLLVAAGMRPAYSRAAA
jgi:hypothetical protein